MPGMARRPDRRPFVLGAAGLAAALILFASPIARANMAPVANERLVVAAAASTLGALNDAIRAYSALNDALPAARRLSIVPVYASSGALARQIAEGGPARVFISANAKWMDSVARAGRLRPDTRKLFVANALVLAARAGSGLKIELLSGVDLAARLGSWRLVTADPQHAPLGQYAEAALRNLGAWKGIEGRLLRVADAAQARVLVERGAAAGILYATDVAGNRRLETLAAFPQGSHPPAAYEIAIVGMAEPAADYAAARAFADWLMGSVAQGIFKSHGFLPAAEVR